MIWFPCYSPAKRRRALSTLPPNSQMTRRSNTQLLGKVYRWVQPAMLVAVLLLFLHVMIGSDMRLFANEKSKQPATKKFRIRSLHLLGERHSGTTWMQNHLKECFGHAVSFRTGLQRWKHWFQESGQYKERKAFVVVVFRHPMQWVEAMRTRPHHANDHYGLPWKEFISKPWTMKHNDEDLRLKQRGSEEAARTCHASFMPKQVIPCLDVGAIAVKNAPVNFTMRPTYELNHNGSGEPYASIVHLRRDKVLNQLSIKDYAGILDFEAVRYEDMVMNGTESLIRRLEKALHTKALCEPYPPKPMNYYLIDGAYEEWLKENIDWAVESLIGYSKPGTGL